MVFDLQDDIEISGWASSKSSFAFVGKTQAGTTVYSGGNLDSNFPFPGDLARTGTF
jgi:hypothetical protein